MESTCLSALPALPFLPAVPLTPPVTPAVVLTRWVVLTAADTAEHADRVLRAFYGFPCYYADGEKKVELLCRRAYAGDRKEGEFPLSDGYIR